MRWEGSDDIRWYQIYFKPAPEQGLWASNAVKLQILKAESCTSQVFRSGEECDTRCRGCHTPCKMPPSVQLYIRQWRVTKQTLCNGNHLDKSSDDERWDAQSADVPERKIEENWRWCHTIWKYLAEPGPVNELTTETCVEVMSSEKWVETKKGTVLNKSYA